MNNLAIIPTNDTWAIIQQLDAATYESRKFGTTKGEMVMRCLTAFEMGLPLSTGLRGIYIIDNKPAIAPKLVWALIMRHPDFDGYEEKELKDAAGNFAGWELTIRRKNSPVKEVTRRFTLDDARRITNGKGRLADKDNWKNYPQQMCYWRTLGMIEDIQWVDITFGMLRADELGGNITPEGDVIEGTYTAGPINTEPQITLDDLLTDYTPDQIMAANGGAIPGTVAELQAVKAVLNVG